MPDSEKASFDLADYQGENRLLLVFAPSAKSPAFEEQIDVFEDEEAEMKDRDLLLAWIFEEGKSRLAKQAIDADSSAALRDRFNVEEGSFRVLLIGKDGTEKRRDDAPVKPVVIYKKIDVMPMRQREMKERDQ